jgi:RNA polymerase sigma-70 factor (ECF subfamily)
VTQAAAYIVADIPRTSPELDGETLDKCRAGDARALHAFVVRYERLVFAFVSRAMGAGPHVEDLAQEVFLRAFRALHRFDTSAAARPSTWLLTIASRLVIDERRKRRLGQPRPEDPTGWISCCASTWSASGSTPETERRRKELGRAIARAALELTDDQRDVFVLAEFHGLEMAEMARVLGVAEGTVKTRLFRARERLRVLLADELEET